MAMLIEAYSVEGAIALAEKYSLDFLSKLIAQTARMRQDPEEREQQRAEKKLSQWLDKNKERSISIPDEEGKTRKINLANYAVRFT